MDESHTREECDYWERPVRIERDGREFWLAEPSPPISDNPKCPICGKPLHPPS